MVFAYLLTSSRFLFEVNTIKYAHSIGKKVYVAVKADFNEEGIMLPREITWEDGMRYTIDRVLDIRQAAAMTLHFCINKKSPFHMAFMAM